MTEQGDEQARIPDGTEAVAKGTMVGVPKGTRVIVRHQSPSEYEAGPRLYWLELPDYIYWSHGRSESKGYWGTAAEFDVVTRPGNSDGSSA
jgi:hypothetical protein